MKSIRERFVRTHRKEVQYAPNKKGYRNVIVYIGDFYTWEPPGRSFSSIRKLFIALQAATIILFGLSSIPGTVISYSSFVVSAALISFVAWVFELYGLISFCFKKLPLQEDDYAYVKKVFRITYPVRCAFLLFSTVMGFIEMHEKGFETSGVLACIGYLLTALIALFLYIVYLKTARSVKVIPSAYKPEGKDKQS